MLLFLLLLLRPPLINMYMHQAFQMHIFHIQPTAIANTTTAQSNTANNQHNTVLLPKHRNLPATNLLLAGHWHFEATVILC